MRLRFTSTVTLLIYDPPTFEATPKDIKALPKACSESPDFAQNVIRRYELTSCSDVYSLQWVMPKLVTTYALN